MLQRNTLRGWFFVGLILATGGAAPAYAQSGVTVQGEIVDLACYMAKGSKGPAHKACAQMCAKKGLPIGLLTAHQGVLLLLANDQDPAAYEAVKQLAGEHAEVSGNEFRKDGMDSIVVGSVKPLSPHAAADSSRVLAVNRSR
jgi:hypothetical protein